MKQHLQNLRKNTGELVQSPIDNPQYAVIFYDEEGLANVKLPQHPCPHCLECRENMAGISHVYGIAICQKYFNEALEQLKGYGVRVLAIISYEPYEETKTYTLVKVRGNLRYTMDSGIMYSRP